LQEKEDNVGPTEAEHTDDQTEKREENPFKEEDDLELSGGILITRTLLPINILKDRGGWRSKSCAHVGAMC
jgi:hypothetical protein